MDSEQQLIELKKKTSTLQFGYKLLATVILSLTSFGDIVATFSIDAFRRIFSDLLHGEPLSTSTYFVFHFQILLITLAFIWPILGLYALFITKRLRLAIVILAAVQGAILIQWGLIVYSVIPPMLSLLNSIQNLR